MNLKKILNWLKENWLVIAIGLFFFITIFYCTNKSSYASDDYPYSLLYRGEERITNIIQIAKNQISDYQNIAGRIVTNGLGQLILMFPRPVFALFNATILLISAILTLKIIEEYSQKAKKYRPIIFALIIGLFLSMDLTKYLVYWVMGSTNYIFMMPLLLLFIYLNKKLGLFRFPKLTGLFIGAVASFHESLLVFFIIYILGSIIHDLLQKEKLNKWYIFYICMLILASLFVFLSPGNQIRNSTWYPEWNQMNFIEKLTTTIPVVSKTMFGVNSYHNIIPFIFILTINISLLFKKDNISKLLVYSNFIVYILAVILNDGWLYLILASLLFIAESYYHYLEKNNNLIIASLSFYAIVYAMIITPEYAAGRPNYFMYWYMIIIIGMIINNLKNKHLKIIMSIAIVTLALGFSVREIYIYKQIGSIVNEREKAIENVKNTNANVLLFKKIPEELTMYQMEPNTPAEEGYWAHKYFCSYYGLNQDIKIVLID